MRRLPVRLTKRPRVHVSYDGGLAILANRNLATPSGGQVRLLANVRDHPDVKSRGGASLCHDDPRDLRFRRGVSLGSVSGHDNPKRPSERTLKLGKTIRILHERMPELLATPLPQDILSPNIKLQLFPSTHPHLPSVRGRLAYTAALWTSPVAWGRVPVVGNVKLVVLSERMLRSGTCSGSSEGGEKLVVRWRTCGQGEVTDQIKKIFSMLGRRRNGTDTAEGSAPKKEEDFHGIFIFEFDDDGRVVAHTIEHVEESNNWERTARVISVTDWLLGKAWGSASKEPNGLPGLAFARARNERQS